MVGGMGMGGPAAALGAGFSQRGTPSPQAAADDADDEDDNGDGSGDD